MNPIPGINRSALSVHVIRFITSERPQVQAFIDVVINGWLRLNGLHLMRDGSLRAAQLTPLIRGKRAHIDSIQVIDRDLRESLTAAILAAIREHLETLPPDQRVKPPRPREPDRRPPQTVAVAKLAPIRPKPIESARAQPALKPQLPPPAKLLANLRRADAQQTGTRKE
jgi:hypothetical protein